MNELDLVRLIADNGIAVGVAWFVLTRINPNLERMAESLNKLERRIERLEDKILTDNPNSRIFDSLTRIEQCLESIQQNLKGVNHHEC